TKARCLRAVGARHPRGAKCGAFEYKWADVLLFHRYQETALDEVWIRELIERRQHGGGGHAVLLCARHHLAWRRRRCPLCDLCVDRLAMGGARTDGGEADIGGPRWSTHRVDECVPVAVVAHADDRPCLLARAWKYSPRCAAIVVVALW